MSVRPFALLVTLALLVGCTGSTSTSSRTASHSPYSPSPSPSPRTLSPETLQPLLCPKDLPQPRRFNQVPGTSYAIVPGQPRALVLCGPDARALMTNAVDVQRFAEELNHLKRVPSGAVYACPADFGPTYGLFFNYVNGDVLLVTVDASGCRFVSNGRSTAWQNRPILKEKIVPLLRAR